MKNGIQDIIVVKYVPEMKEAFELSCGLKIVRKDIEILVLYDEDQTVYTVNKKHNDFHRYPEYNLGRLIVRPLWDLKCSMFAHNGRVFVRFTYQIHGHYQQFTKELGIISEGTLIPGDNYKTF